MPPSALDTLTRLNIVYPMLFKLTNNKTDRVTHCGVLEFVADEGKVYLPYWMMRNLLLEEGGLVIVESISLPIATFSKFQPQSEDFLDIFNPKAVLENALRNFACLTTSDMIAIKYNDKIYELCVLETKPGKAVSIIECDMNVEFAPPLDYKEPSQEADLDARSEDMVTDGEDLGSSSFMAFYGKGNRLDGKKKGTEESPRPLKMPQKRGIPDYDYKVGTLRFIRNLRPTPSSEVDLKDQSSSFHAFSGQGKILRDKNSRK